MKFNSASCMEEGCLSRGIPCIEFAIGSKLRDKIGPDKPKADNGIDIKPVNAKHFFWMARKKDHKGYMWIPCVLNRDCTSKNCTNGSYVAKWCANTTSITRISTNSCQQSLITQGRIY